MSIVWKEQVSSIVLFCREIGAVPPFSLHSATRRIQNFDLLDEERNGVLRSIYVVCNLEREKKKGHVLFTP